MCFNIYFLVLGGMQDWNYLHSNCFEITIELGCVKYPYEKDLPGYWTANEYALLVFMGQVRDYGSPSLHICLSIQPSHETITPWFLDDNLKQPRASEKNTQYTH